eukprot:7236335-Pyramimonas_sp.AAC.1
MPTRPQPLIIGRRSCSEGPLDVEASVRRGLRWGAGLRSRDLDVMRQAARARGGALWAATISFRRA